MKKTEKQKLSFYSAAAFISFIVFAVCQLAISSVLTPLGSQLQSLNTEKDFLLEENRKISEEIAKSGSIRVIEKLSEKKLSLSQDKVQTFIYIEDTTLVANY